MSTSSEGRPGKYERSAGGLVAALVITVVAVGGLLWILGLFRADTEIERERIDYLSRVEEAQEGGLKPVYPSSLPDGWKATDWRYSPGGEPTIETNLLTGDDEDFVGIRERSGSAEDLVADFVDDDATAADILTVEGSVAEAWQGYEDEDGDAAYVAEVGDQTVLVYGSASPEELEDLIGRLTTKPVED
jgi:hypothetical protein